MPLPKLTAVKRFLPVSILFVIVIFTSCEKTVDKSAAKNIIAFAVRHSNGMPIDTSKIEVSISSDSITILLPPGTDLNGLIPDIKITGVSISPSSGVPQDFSKPVTYTVTAQDGSSANYYVTVGFQPLRNIVFAGSSDHNFYALDALSGKLIWKYTGGGWFSYASPVAINGIVYAGCTDDTVYAFNAGTGAVIWKFRTGGAIEASLSVVDGVVYAGSVDDYLYALNALTGEMKWKFRTGENVSSKASVLNGVVYFGSSDANIYALDVSSGSLKWKFTAGAMINQSGVVISKGVLFVGSRDGSLYAVDAVSGNLKWKYSTNGISLEESTPSVVDGLVYIAGWYNIGSFSIAGSVYAIDQSTGSLVWQSLNALGFSSSPYLSAGRLYISADDGNFYALNSSTGAVLWSKPILPNSAGAAVADGIVYVGGGGTGFIYAFDAVTGTERWKFPVGSEGIVTSTPCVIDSNGQIYSLGDSGSRY